MSPGATIARDAVAIARDAVAAGTASRPTAVFGWDIGGAHVKVSQVDADGTLRDVAQWACTLWQGTDHLERAIDDALRRWPEARAAGAAHAVTMTGEMVDLFGHREAGVQALTDLISARLGAGVRYFAGDVGDVGDMGDVGDTANTAWIGPAGARAAWRRIASANWRATAQWVASRLPDAVLVDIGSTTTDIVPIAQGRVATLGHDDAQRLASGELVYQGVVRTPLCALLQRVRFGGIQVNVMNEWFAATADVYRLTGELLEEQDQHPAADNGPKTPAGSRQRLARMIGRDARDADDAAWLDLAQRWRRAQRRRIAANLARVMARRTDAVPLVGAGCGRFLVAELARETGRDYIDFDTLLRTPLHSAWVSTCAPSVATGLLLASALGIGTHD